MSKVAINRTKTIPPRDRTTVCALGVVLLGALLAGAPLEASSRSLVRLRERAVEKAQRKVDNASETRDEARRAQEEAQRQLGEEQERLRKEGEENPHAHGTQEELDRLREQATEAQEALDESESNLAEAEEDLAQAEARLEEARRAYDEKQQKRLDDFFDKYPIPDDEDDLDDFERRVAEGDIDRDLKRRIREKIEEKRNELDDQTQRAGRSDHRQALALFETPRPPAGSRVILTGSVVAEQEASLTVVGPSGERLSGVVVDVGGELETTDRDGRILFGVASGLSVLRAVLVDADGNTGAEAVVEEVVDTVGSGMDGAGMDSMGIDIDRVPRYPTAGSELPIPGRGFSGNAARNRVSVGDVELPVLASSPSELVVATPSDWLGDRGDLVVETDTGRSQGVPVTFVRMRLEGNDVTLKRGQSSVSRIVVEGTRERLPLRVTNLTPAVVRLDGGDEQTVRTTGGATNSARLRFTGVAAGSFSLNAEIDHQH